MGVDREIDLALLALGPHCTGKLWGQSITDHYLHGLSKAPKPRRELTEGERAAFLAYFRDGKDDDGRLRKEVAKGGKVAKQALLQALQIPSVCERKKTTTK